MEEETQPKWEGKSMVELASVKAEQVWPCFDEDFCNLHKWFPVLDTCCQIQGQLGQPGLIRYSTTTEPLFPVVDDHEKTINWGKEKLLMIDPIQRCLSYEMLDNTFGFKSYVAIIKVLPINDDGKIGCKIEWSFVADPIDGKTFEDLASVIDYCLQFMAKKMEHAILQSGSV